MFSFVNPEKHLNKVVSRVWKDKDVSMVQIQLPDSLKTVITQLNEVYFDEKLVGYACFTSAFGCRIGGCAAPSNPNIQSYDTFDYVVIYDPEFKILKVDIASYTGQYGYEICRRKWLEQFNGKKMNFKLEGNIDGISGATVSAAFLIDDLNVLGMTLAELQISEIL